MVPPFRNSALFLTWISSELPSSLGKAIKKNFPFKCHRITSLILVQAGRARGLMHGNQCRFGEVVVVARSVVGGTEQSVSSLDAMARPRRLTMVE